MPPDGLLFDAGPGGTNPLRRAARAFAAGQFGEAAQLCIAVLADAPGHAWARRQLGLLRLVSGDPAGCLALLLPLRTVFAADADVAVALAEAAWAVDGAAHAIAHYRRALALAPDHARARARLGLALLLAGQPGPACRELERATRDQPDAAALTHLGMALLALGRPADAVPALLHAAQLDPSDPGSTLHLGQALRDLGRIADAVSALEQAVRRAPGQAHLHLALGDALSACGDHARGKAELRRATALDPAQPLAWARLGDVEQLTGDHAAALACYRCAVALDKDDPDLLALLGNALLAAGDLAGERELGRSMQTAWAKPRPRSRTVRVGVLAAPGTANTPTGFILDRTRFAVSPVFMLGGFDYPCARLAETYDVLFNAVSDPDAAPLALALAARLAPGIGLPVVNAPAAIPGTTRDCMAERLAGIPGLHVPRTKRTRRAESMAWDGPVLVRAVGSHGGAGLTVSHSAAEARQAAAALSGDEVYVTEFVDFRSAGGLYRKLRMVFVDGQAFPVHLAIGEHWLSHYFRTAMAERPDWRAEEAAFLAGHQAYLGRDACRALDAVQARVGLDFFGLDCAVGPDGRLLVFECNAAMLVRHADRPAMFDYKRHPAERIRSAVGDLLHRRCGC